jgi:sulfur relay (sulfurtransferase) DsrC/TusE family protein
MGIINVVPETQAQQEVKEAEVTKPQQEDTTKLAELARREKAMRLQSREMQAMKQAIAQREAEYKILQEELERERGFKSKLKSSPWDALIEAGFSPEEATTAFLNQPSAENIELKQLRAELAAIRAEQDQFKKTSQKAQEESYTQAKKQIESEVNQLVSSNEEYEMVKSMGAVQQVVDYIESTYQESGQLLDIETAAKHVEEFLMDEAMKLSKIKKLQSKFMPQESQAQSVNLAPQLKTLSNQLNAGSKPLTAKERRERAIAAFKGQSF